MTAWPISGMLYTPDHRRCLVRRRLIAHGLGGERETHLFGPQHKRLFMDDIIPLLHWWTAYSTAGAQLTALCAAHTITACPSACWMTALEIPAQKHHRPPKTGRPPLATKPPARRDTKYRESISQLRDIFPNWSPDDLQQALEDLAGDVELVISRISEGTVFAASLL